MVVKPKLLKLVAVMMSMKVPAAATATARSMSWSRQRLMPQKMSLWMLSPLTIQPSRTLAVRSLRTALLCFHPLPARLSNAS
jgi:hypothetical protein